MIGYQWNGLGSSPAPFWCWPGPERPFILQLHVAELGYGEHGAGDIIPGGATLYFEIELIEVEDGPTPVNVFRQIDSDDDHQLSREELAGYLRQQVQKYFLVLYNQVLNTVSI